MTVEALNPFDISHIKILNISTAYELGYKCSHYSGEKNKAFIAIPVIFRHLIKMYNVTTGTVILILKP